MRDEIRRFLMTNGAHSGGDHFTDDDSLLDQGVIDSVTMVDLITFLESRFGFQIEDEEMTPENFDSLNAIVAFVESKQADVGPVSAS